MPADDIVDLAHPDEDQWRRFAGILLFPFYDIDDLDYEGIIDVASGLHIDPEKILARMIAIFRQLTDVQTEVDRLIEEFREMSQEPQPAKAGEAVKVVDVGELLRKREIKDLSQDEIDRYMRKKHWSLDALLEKEYESIRMKFFRVINGVETCNELYGELEVLAERSMDVRRAMVDEHIAGRREAVIGPADETGDFSFDETSEDTSAFREAAARIESNVKKLADELLEIYIETLYRNLGLVEMKNGLIEMHYMYFNTMNALVAKYLEYIPPEHLQSYQ